MEVTKKMKNRSGDIEIVLVDDGVNYEDTYVEDKNISNTAQVTAQNNFREKRD